MLLRITKSGASAALFLLCLCLLLTVKYFTFRLGLHTSIFPMVETVFLYDYNSRYPVANWQLFAIGVIFDIFSNSTLGTNAIALLLANAVDQRILSLKLHLQGFTYQIGLFAIYLIIVFIIKFILVWYKENYCFLHTDLIIQYMFTLVVYTINLRLSSVKS